MSEIAHPLVRIMDEGLAKKIDEPVLQGLSLPRNRSVSPSRDWEDYPDFAELRVSDDSVVLVTFVPIPGTLALIVLALPMLVSFSRAAR